MSLFSRLRNRKGERPEAAAPEAPAEPLAADETFEADEVTFAAHSRYERDFDFTGFWHDTSESERRHRCPPPTPETVLAVEDELGYKLPSSYIELMRLHNGGLVNRCRYRVPAPAEGCPDTIYITEILGISTEVPYSLCGRFGSSFLIDSRKHKKDIGVAICNTTLPGRALVFLDYRACGRTGEPCVTWADAVEGTEIHLAHDFAEFVRGLEANTVSSQA